MKQVLPTYSSIKKVTVVYFGEKNELEAQMILSSVDRSSLKLVRAQDLSNTLHWLKVQAGGGQELTYPLAILCDYNALAQDNFQFLDTIQSDVNLRNIPFFVHTDNLANVDREAAIKRGIDDCFEAPLNWKEIQQRINFWLTYKSSIKGHMSVSLEQGKLKLVSTAKRIVDLIGASALLLALSPVLALISLAVRLDSSGPIFYCSTRIGSGYRRFNFWKFRSMYQDADQRLKDLIHMNQYEAGDNCFVKIKNDPRITRVGRLIRKTSLDELPQLFNVITGDMSLVGNRPLPVYEAELMVRDDWAARFLAPAGLTGLWQVTKRGKDDMSTAERVGLDVEYAKNHSFWYDLNLLFKTLPAMIQEEDV